MAEPPKSYVNLSYFPVLLSRRYIDLAISTYLYTCILYYQLKGRYSTFYRTVSARVVIFERSCCIACVRLVGISGFTFLPELVWYA